MVWLVMRAGAGSVKASRLYMGWIDHTHNVALRDASETLFWDVLYERCGRASITTNACAQGWSSVNVTWMTAS